MKSIAILIVVVILPMTLFSQDKKYEYTPKVKNRVEVSDLLGEIILKNSTGNSIVIESDFDMEKPERAEGLQLLGATEDNTELGITVTEEEGVVKIMGATKKVKDYVYTISVPQDIAVSIDYNSPFASEDLEIDSYRGSVEIKTLAANVKLTDCSGPFTVSSISGDIEAVFNSLNQDLPTSLATISGLIDVSIPAGLKARVKLSNMTGDVYNNLDLEAAKENEDDDRAKGLDKIKRKSKGEYTLNGGGQLLTLKTISGNLYLRKK